MATTKLLLKYNKKNKMGEIPFYIRIIKNRKAHFLSTGIFIKPEYWDEENHRVRKSHKNASYINAYLAGKLADAERMALDLETSKNDYSKKKAKREILGRSDESFLSFAENYVEKLKEKGNQGTYHKAEIVLRKLKQYLKNKDLKFDNLNVAFLKDYEEHLRAEHKNSVNTIHSNLKVIRRWFNEAIREDYVPPEKSPFLRFKLNWENVEKTFLTEDELKQIEDFEVSPTSAKRHHRNMYVFSAYAGGLRISDVLQLKWENFDGERVLVTTQKTGSVVSVKLPAKALEIVNSYKTGVTKPSDFVFPLLKNDVDYSDPAVLYDAISSMNAYTNKSLKEIKTSLKWSKNLNFHTSRHTWATRALKKGMRIEYVSKLMGHSSIKTTQVYAKIVNADLDQAMKEFDETLVKEAKERKEKDKKKEKKIKVKQPAQKLSTKPTIKKSEKIQKKA